MTYTHNIFIANSYRYGDRIAYDLVLKTDEMSEELEDKKVIEEFLTGVFDCVGKDTALTTHTVTTDSEKWESVIAIDSFFGDIKLIKKRGNFIKYLKYNSTLTKYDIKSLLLALLDYKCESDSNVDDMVTDIAKKYERYYGKPLYSEFSGDRRKVLPQKVLKNYTNIILNRVLAAKDGFEKFDFLLRELKEKMGKPVII